MLVGNLRNAWKQLKRWGSNNEGRGQIQTAMQLCPAADLASAGDVDELAQWAQNAFDYLVGCECSVKLPRILPFCKLCFSTPCV